MLINDHIDHNENNPNEIVDKNVFEEKIHCEQMIDDIWHIERQIIYDEKKSRHASNILLFYSLRVQSARQDRSTK